MLQPTQPRLLCCCFPFAAAAPSARGCARNGRGWWQDCIDRQTPLVPSKVRWAPRREVASAPPLASGAHPFDRSVGRVLRAARQIPAFLQGSAPCVRTPYLVLRLSLRRRLERTMGE
ncbi:hypothetical protein C8Q77DRAFT_1091261 [Trametes polyzona]|nr:hypothetical protein C8Q77DRAFT_1091261 [Trametes polyzona]